RRCVAKRVSQRHGAVRTVRALLETSRQDAFHGTDYGRVASLSEKNAARLFECGEVRDGLRFVESAGSAESPITTFTECRRNGSQRGYHPLEESRYDSPANSQTPPRRLRDAARHAS